MSKLVAILMLVITASTFFNLAGTSETTGACLGYAVMCVWAGMAAVILALEEEHSYDR